MTEHEWIPSPLGHGETMCTQCKMTNREARVLDSMHTCPNVQAIRDLYVGQLTDHELKLFDRLCLRGIAYRYYNNPLGAAKVGIRWARDA